MNAKICILMGVTALILGACEKREEILAGERIAVRADADGAILASAATDVAEGSVPLTLPAAQRLAAWPMRVGTASNDPAHATLAAAPARIWTANIGSGDTRRQRITADPVSDGTQLYTLDAQSTVTAVSLSGQVVWSRSLVPPAEKANEASGGGLAVVGGALYVTTGFGELHVLDPASGAERWVQRLDAPITTPKVEGGLVYLVSRDNRAWAIEADTGRIRWDIPAAQAQAATATAPSPAISGRLAIFPYASGEIVATLKASGIRVWGSSVSGRRRGVASGFVGDITGDPVVADGIVYAGTSSGRLVALEQSSGTRVWTADEGAVSPLVVSGGSLFAVSDRAQLLRIDAATGDPIWRTDLPYYRNQRLSRRQGIYAHFGPVLAGGKLWVASSDGALRGFDPVDGTQITQIDIPGGAASRPIVFGDALYVVGRGGDLHAYR
ncbi:PQQ-binding-like beta-propeller repeat protein [Jannaschia sp. 2305UL9-9]|uniref:PQQ-like beta-propeller repeat protein n=1 Tax=Jannaschia sp. 2305UL9-9 TaxID=3121638 RepID=UPI0035280049